MISRELAGDFVNYLYEHGFIPGNLVAAKTFVQGKFRDFLEKANRSCACNMDSTLDQLLRDYKFVDKNVPDDKIYKFDMRAIINYRNDVIAKMDKKEIENAKNAILSTVHLKEKKSAKGKRKDYNTGELIFQFKIKQHVTERLISRSKGCYCCQMNFHSEEEFTDHVQFHSKETDFKYRSLNEHDTLPPEFSIAYLTGKGDNLVFSIESVNNRRDIIIEKIIVFQKGSVHYPEDYFSSPFLPKKLVYFRDISEKRIFSMKRDAFQVMYEQPLLVVFKSKKDPSGVRYVEEHHFFRFDNFTVSRKGELKNAEVDEFDKHHDLAKQLYCNDFDEKTHPVERNIRDYLKKLTPLTPENICDVYDLLVKMDYYEISEGYEKYDRDGVRVKRQGCEYSVMISGLMNVKQKNTLTKGDRIILLAGRYFHGTITNIVRDCVYFETNNDKIPILTWYTVTFEPQSLCYIYQLMALKMLRDNSQLLTRLFPEVSEEKCLSSVRLDFYNPTLETVPEQKDAVQNIVENQNKHVPFIIFGPPGTGKTTVVVEAIIQLRKQSRNNRILVMAGSNAACDEIAARLAKTFKTIDADGPTFLRIYACSSGKRIDNMNEDVLKASNFCYGKHFYPSLETINTYSIVIVTLCVAGTLVHGEISSNHFTHVFIDECGSSTEPESIMGMAGILSSSAHLILSGDPKQLGPIIKCRRAADYGLEISLLERLMARKCYEPHPITREYNRSIQARLTRNFRSHKDILALPNQLFYENQLKVMAPPEITDFGIEWSGLESKTFPIVFNSVSGVMCKLKNSTSSCNYEELNCVLLCLKELLYFGIRGRKIKQEDIGVISPYKMQCQLIRRALDQRGWFRIETGSVETFQGQEKPIIIASMVRSKVNSPGFLDSPKRLNVLLTRAQALLILIGNADTLVKIGQWKDVVKYCIENNALREVEVQMSDHDSDESDATVRSMQNLCINNHREQTIQSRYRHPLQNTLQDYMHMQRTKNRRISRKK